MLAQTQAPHPGPVKTYFYCAALLVAAGGWPVPAADLLVYFGTHQATTNAGFSLAHFDTDTGELTKPEFLLAAPGPAFFEIHPDGRHLYACNASGGGDVSAYEIEPHTGQLSLLNSTPSGGGEPCYLSFDHTARYALVANYDGGNVGVFALRADGGIGGRTGFAQHTGSSVDPRRQTHAYAHAMVAAPDNRFVLSADLGVDKIYSYRFSSQDGSLRAGEPACVRVAMGSGPRHLKFHPNGRWVYALNELASTVVGFNWNAETGALAEFQTVSTLPSDYFGANTAAEIVVHPNGKFLYASNRGHNSLAVFAIDPKSGWLKLVEYVPSEGKLPRFFTFDPTGKWILCCNHGSENAVIFRCDETTGRLTKSGPPVEVAYPFCARFLPVR